MISALSIIAVFTIVVFLGGAAFGALVISIVSIHRTSRAPLSEIHGEQPGSISRRMLTGGRVNCKQPGE